MSHIHVIASDVSRYNRRLIQELCEKGFSPTTVHLGSPAERIIFKIRSLRRVSKRLGLKEAFRRLLRARREAKAFAQLPDASAPLSFNELREKYGFNVRYYDLLNEGSLIVDLLTNRDSIGVLAGCGIVGRSLIAACGKGCLNGHPALLPGLRGVDVVEAALIQNLPFGVAAHRVTEFVDAGPILRIKPLSPRANEDFLTFKSRIEMEQAICLSEAVIDVARGTTVETPNDLKKSKMCYALPETSRILARRKFNDICNLTT